MQALVTSCRNVNTCWIPRRRDHRPWPGTAVAFQSYYAQKDHAFEPSRAPQAELGTRPLARRVSPVVVGLPSQVTDEARWRVAAEGGRLPQAARGGPNRAGALGQA